MLSAGIMSCICLRKRALGRQPASGSVRACNLQSRIRTADEQRGQAAKFALENKLEETCNVLNLDSKHSVVQVYGVSVK